MRAEPENTVEENQRLGVARTSAVSHNGLAVRFGQRWVQIEDQSAEDSSRQRKVGEPGLWKWVRGPGGPRRVFEIPAWCVSLTTDEDPEALEVSGPLPLRHYLEWATATRKGAVPPGWQMPSSDLVQSWLRPGEMTVRSRGCLRQIELVSEPRSWALRMALVPLHPELPEARRRALEAFATDLEDHVAMVRIGIAENQPPTLVAEVCLTGAPSSELLFLTGLDALRHVARLIETAEALSDASVVLACLADAEIATKSQKGEKC